MKKILLFTAFILALFSFNIYAEYISSANIPNLPKKEKMTYIGASKKKKETIIMITYNTQVQKNMWVINEAISNKNSFTETKSNIRLSDMECVSSVTREKYDFGTIETTFKLLDDVIIPKEEGVFYFISFNAITQITRSYPMEAKQIEIKFTKNKETKIKLFINNNGIKDIKIGENTFSAYELELKVSGFPFASLMPKILAYIENDDKRKALMYKGYVMGDVMTLTLTEYSGE